MADDSYDYRVKFKDIRVKPPRGGAGGRAASSIRICDHPSCDLPGEHEAPKRGGGRHYFCQRHAGEYNRSWNFFDNMTEEEVAAFNEAARNGHKKTWRFGTGPMGGRRAADVHDPRLWRGREIFEEGADAPESRAPRGRTRLQIRALVELDLPEDAAPADIRARYADYVRRFHPDSNGGDRSYEDKLSRVIQAFKTLKAAGIAKD